MRIVHVIRGGVGSITLVVNGRENTGERNGTLHANR